MPTDHFRMATFISLLKRGANERVAAQGAIAIHLLHDDVRPARGFEKECRRLSKATAKATKKASVEELGPIYESALIRARDLAREHNEPFYEAQAQQQLDMGSGD